MVEAEYKNSGGYFRFPDTGEEITADTPRAVTCKPGEKWVHPAVMLSDGNIVKISGRTWNADERACYKEYRNRGSSSGHSRISKPKQEKEKKPKAPEETERILVKFDEQAAVSEKTQEIINKCDEYLGVIQTQGLRYSLLSIKGTRCVYSVPLSAISQEDMLRLCQ